MKVPKIIQRWPMTLLMLALAAIILYTHYTTPTPDTVKSYTDQVLYNLPVGMSFMLVMFGTVIDMLGNLF